jgi:anaerobic selenocysteine-containing dehydrogenase
MDAARTACILCSRNCGLVVDVEDGHLTRIRGDADHPLSKGYICQKAARLEHYQHHANRVRQPLKRRPDGSFAALSWDAALGEIAARLLAIRKRHGGDAFAFVGGGGQGNHLGGAYSRQLLAAMGSRYVYSSLAQEKTGDFWVNGRLFGRQSCHTTEDVEHADYVLFIGAIRTSRTASPTRATRYGRSGTRRTARWSWSTRAAPKRPRWPTFTCSCDQAPMPSCCRPCWP